MTKRHAPSLFVSLVVHIFAVLIVLFTYKYAHSISEEKEQEKLSISLQLCIPKYEVKKEEKKTPLPPKKIIKKKQVTHKKTLKQKKLIKKEVALKTVEKLEKTVEKTVEKIITIEKTKPQKTSLPVESKKQNKKTNKEKYLNNHLTEISQLLQSNLYYPRRARKRGIEGEVLVKFHLYKDASVGKIEVVSSKSEILSRSAIKTIQDLSGQFPNPSEELVLQIPIQYSLK